MVYGYWFMVHSYGFGVRGSGSHIIVLVANLSMFDPRGHDLLLWLPGYKRLTPAGSCFVTVVFW